jgi:hypothetical protein
VCSSDLADAPELLAMRGGSVRGWAYDINDKADIRFCLPHDYAPGTDIYLHIYWAHNGQIISGNLVATCLHIYAKGHDQEIFPVEKTILISESTPDIATIPQYSNRLTEVQLSASSPTGSQIDSDNLEPDGTILLNLGITTLPTISGGSTSKIFITGIDIHYQTTGINTKQKTIPFYT